MIKTENKHIYDLEERTLKYGKRIVYMCQALNMHYDPINKRLADQVLRSGTSVGANYREANETETKKDFCFRMRICRKEAKETVYWLKLITEHNPLLAKRLESLSQETAELVKIFATIIEKSRSK